MLPIYSPERMSGPEYRAKKQLQLGHWPQWPILLPWNIWTEPIKHGDFRGAINSQTPSEQDFEGGRL